MQFFFLLFASFVFQSDGGLHLSWYLMLYNSNSSFDFLPRLGKPIFYWSDFFHARFSRINYEVEITLSKQIYTFIYTVYIINVKFLCIMLPPNILHQQGAHQISGAGCFFIVTLKFNEVKGRLWTHRQWVKISHNHHNHKSKDFVFCKHLKIQHDEHVVMFCMKQAQLVVFLNWANRWISD